MTGESARQDMALLMERLEEERATSNDLRHQLEVTARQQTDVLMDIQRDVQRMRESMFVCPPLACPRPRPAASHVRARPSSRMPCPLQSQEGRAHWGAVA